MGTGRFVSYIRVSTAAQGASGLGLEAQREAIARHVSAVGGLLVAEYEEIESGAKDDRPQLARAIAHAKREKAVLVIARLDRLGRRLRKIAELLETVDFVAVDQPSATRFTIGIMACVAEEERRLISERTKAALAAKKARGEALGNGWTMTYATQKKGGQARRSQAVESYAPLVDRLRMMHLDMRMSYRKIAAALNEEGKVNAQGRPFNHMTVKAILERAA